MAEVMLTRRLSEPAAIDRLRRLGATSCEPAWLRLWAYGVGESDAATDIWLLCHRDARRGLLWMGDLPTRPVSPEEEALFLGGVAAPETDAVSWLWFWERLGSRRRWRARVQAQAPQAIFMPLWLGYGYVRGTQRLMVISGLSGEAMAALKPALLAELSQLTQEADVMAR